MGVSRLLYVSSATRVLLKHELERLAKSSAERNAALNLTGILLYSGGHFIQLLEGEKSCVTHRFMRIAKDLRHDDVQKLLFEPADERIFGAWNMGLLNLDLGPELHRVALMTTINHLRAQGSRSSAISMALLRQFREQLPSAA